MYNFRCSVYFWRTYIPLQPSVKPHKWAKKPEAPAMPSAMVT